MIDWFTVVAQIANFLILVGLLRYFLYGRVLAAMDMRQAELAANWEEARNQREEAAGELNAAREKNRQLEDQREKLLGQVREEVDRYRAELTAKVRREVDELQVRWADTVHQETESFLRDLRRRTSEQVCTIARRALADLAGDDLERRIVERFIAQIEQLGDSERQAVIAAFNDGNRVAVVQTAYELDADARTQVTRVLQERFLTDLKIQFERSADLLCGIALQTDAHKLAWDLRDYLAALEQDLHQALEEEAEVRRPTPQPATIGT